MDSKWLFGIVGLIVGLVVAGGIGLGLELGSDEDEDDDDGSALVCRDLDASALGSFVVVTTPTAGESVGDQFPLEGCAATFEQNVSYRVTDRGGSVLAEGFTMTNAPDLGITGEF